MPVPIPNLNQLQINPPQPATMRMQGMQMQNQLSQLGMQKERLGIQREGMDLEREGFEFNKMKQNLMIGKEHLPTLQKSEYGKYRKWVESIGAPAQFLPSEEDVSKMSEKDFSDLKLRMILGSDNIGKMNLESYKSTIREQEESTKQKNRIELKKIVPGKAPEDGGKNLTKMQLTKMALEGDQGAARILEEMLNQSRATGEAAAQGKIAGLLKAINVDEIAETIIDGRETIENVPNPFGVPLRAIVRDKVLEKDPKLNFILPRTVVRAIDTSLKAQEKQRGLMGSFVRNINKQVSRVDEIAQEISRWGVRALDLPKRELITRLKGSGREKVLEAYLTEISAEIGKLSTGSSASIRELSTEGQARWNKIHDPNLSFKELKIILEERRDMAEMRLSSTNE